MCNCRTIAIVSVFAAVVIVVVVCLICCLPNCCCYIRVCLFAEFALLVSLIACLFVRFIVKVFRLFVGVVGCRIVVVISLSCCLPMHEWLNVCLFVWAFTYSIRCCGVYAYLLLSVACLFICLCIGSLCSYRCCGVVCLHICCICAYDALVLIVVCLVICLPHLFVCLFICLCVCLSNCY